MAKWESAPVYTPKWASAPVYGQPPSPSTTPAEPEQGFFSDVGTLLKQGASQAMSTYQVGPQVISGGVGGTEGIIAKNLAAERFQPEALRQVSEAFKDEGEAMRQAESWYSPQGLRAIGGTVAEIGKQLATNPRGIAYFTAEQAANMVPALVGGLGGAAAGAPLGPVGAMTSGAVGAFGASAPMEIGAEFIGIVGGELSARGLQPTEENIKTLLADEEFRNLAVNQARVKGATVAATDAAFSMFGGRLASAPARKAIADAARESLETGADAAALAKRNLDALPLSEKLVAGAKGYGADVVGAGVGETAGQVAAYGEADLEEVALEVLGEAGGAIVEVPGLGKKFVSAGLRTVRPGESTPVQPALTPDVELNNATNAGEAVAAAARMVDADIEALEREAGLAPTPAATPTPAAADYRQNLAAGRGLLQQVMPTSVTFGEEPTAGPPEPSLTADRLMQADISTMPAPERQEFLSELTAARTANLPEQRQQALTRAAEIYGRTVGPIRAREPRPAPVEPAPTPERLQTEGPDLQALMSADTSGMASEDRSDFVAQLNVARRANDGPVRQAALTRAAEIYGRTIGPIQPTAPAQTQAQPEAATRRTPVPRPTNILGRPASEYTESQLQTILANDKVPAITRKGVELELAARAEVAPSLPTGAFAPTLAPTRSYQDTNANFLSLPETVPVVAAQPMAGQSAAKQARATAQRTMDAWAASEGTPSPVTFGDPTPELEQGIAGVVELLGQQFGAEVVAFSDTRPMAINGVQIAGKTMVNVGSTQLGVPNTSFHELSHFFENLADAEKAAGEKDGPAQELVEQLYSIFDDMVESGKRSYIENLLYAEELTGLTGDKREAFILSKLNDPLTRSEMVADFMGNRATDKKFLQDLAKADPTGFESFVTRWLAVLDNMLTKLRGAKGKARSNLESVKVDSYIRDLNKAKLTAQSALINYRKATAAPAQAAAATEAQPGEQMTLAFSKAQRGGRPERIGDFMVRTHRDGTVGVQGDPEAIRAQIPEDVKGRPVPGGMLFTSAAAPRVKNALAGRKAAYSRGGEVVKQLPMKDGKYIGAPTKYNTPAKITALRNNLRMLTKEGEAGRFWYENSSRAVLSMVGDDIQEARKFVALLSIYSPQAKVDSNSTFALRAWAQYKAGQPIRVKTKVQDGKAQRALADVDAFWSGEKTGNFYTNLLAEIDSGLPQGATIDMWMMRAAEYSNDAPTATQYAFMENETNRIAEELGWEPQQVQAAIWVAMKARMENAGVKRRTEASSEEKGWIRFDYPINPKTGKPKKTRVILDKQAHRDNWLKHAFKHDPTQDDTLGAKFDFSDGLRRHIGQLSWSAAPSPSSGLLPGLSSAPYDQQVEFQQAVQAAILDDDGVDLLAYKLGLLVDGPDILTPGEVVVGMQKQIPMAPGEKSGKFIDSPQRKALDAYAAALGLVTRTDSVTYHRPFYKGRKSDENGVEVDYGRPLTQTELLQLWTAVGEQLAVNEWESKVSFVASPVGMRVVNAGVTEDNLAFVKAVEAAAAKALPQDIRINTFSADTGAVQNNWKENPDGQNYREKILASGSPDLLGWIRDFLAPRVQVVFDDYSEKYNWGNPGQAPRFSRAQADVAARIPELERAAQGIKEGTVTREQYEELVNALKPVTPYEEVPAPATEADIRRGLSSDKLNRIGVPSKTLKAGDPVGLRLDIPAYINQGVWVVSVHEQDPGFAAGKSIGYESVAAVTNPTFGMPESGAVNIAAGKSKAPIAVMKGDWKPTTPKQAFAAAKLALKSDNWVQVGMDPTRHAYFYDRTSMEPVVSADEAIQVGPLVLAKNPVYGNKADFRFSRSQTDTGGPVRIRLGQFDNTAANNALASLQDKLAVNPLNERELMRKGAAVNLFVSNGALRISDIRSTTPRQGEASELLDLVIAEADAAGAKMSLFADSYAEDGGLSTDALVDWYSRRGFEEVRRNEDGVEMRRYPADIRFSRSQTLVVNGVQRPTTNSEGRPIAQSEEALRNFWQWFGDSKVVDDQGRPLVVYHGTRAMNNLEQFDPALTGLGNDQIGSGFYFTTLREEADSYAAPGTRKIKDSDSPGIVEAYLSISNPLTVVGFSLRDTGVTITRKQAADIISRAPNIRDPEKTPLVDWVDVSGGVTDKMISDVAQMYATGQALLSLENDFFRGDAAAYRAALRDVLGFDGATTSFKDRTHWVAWFPTQIKSVDNLGTFNPNDPRIRFSRSQAPADSQVKQVMYRGARNDAEMRPGRAGAIFFSETPEYASQYATGTGGQVSPVYLDVKNLFDFVDNPEHREQAIKMFNESGGWSEATDGERSDYDPAQDMDWEIFDEPNVGLVQQVRDLGYDGIRFRETEDAVAVAVFDSSQVISAISGPRFSRAQQRGINVRNDGDNLYADLIVDGEKTMESRNTNSLRAYVGQTVGIIRTGEGPSRLIGSVKIGEPIQVNEQEFRELEPEHLVPKGSTFDIKPGGTKFLYPLTEARRFDEERAVDSRGIVARAVAFSRSQGPTDLGEARERRNLSRFHKGLGERVREGAEKLAELTNRLDSEGKYLGLEVGDTIMTENANGFRFRHRVLGKSVLEVSDRMRAGMSEEDVYPVDGFRKAYTPSLRVETINGDGEVSTSQLYVHKLKGRFTKMAGPRLSRAQVNTPAFKRWFGNSKVVDENGEPLVVYKGDNNSPEVFKNGANFFTASERMARGYGDTIRKFYISIQNPASYEDVMAAARTVGWSENALEDEIPGIVLHQDESVVAELKRQGFDGWIGYDDPEMDDYDDIDPQPTFVPFSPTQIKSATGNRGTFDPKDPRINFSRAQQNPMKLYSALSKAAQQGPVRAPAAQWKGLLRKSAKPEEITWSGVEDWLDLQEGNVSREAVSEFLAENGVQVGEVVYGSSAFYPLGAFMHPDTGEVDSLDGWRAVTEDYTSDGGPSVEDQLDTLIDVSGDPVDSSATDPRYDEYQLPGGKNYREVLLTLPEKKIVVLPDGYTVTMYPDEPIARVKAGYVVADETNLRVGYNTARLDGRFDTAEEAIKGALKSLNEGAVFSKLRGSYRSSHWYQPNVLAHIRMNDRVDADGARVLFVEELQSDWAQEGRKKGFAKKSMADTEMVATINNSANRPYWEVRTTSGYFVANVMDVDTTTGTPEQAIAMAREIASRRVDDRPPVAPFVQTTDSWLNLALKRVITMAIEGGYDKVAFINGEQSAERYDLSKQIDDLRYDGTMLVALQYGRVVFSEEREPEELPDLVGKEIAERLLQAPEMPGNGYRRLTGLDLKVGGEGMKAFYDSIVPKAVAKLLPKIGGGKLERVNLKSDEFSSKYTVDAEDLGADEDFEQEVIIRDKRSLEGVASFNSIAEAEAWLDDNDVDVSAKMQPGFTITREMTDQVMDAGLPMFSRRQNIFGQPMPAGGWQLGDSRLDEVIYYLQDKLVDTKRVIENISETVGQVADKFDAYLQETLYHGRVATRTTDFADTELKPLIEAMGRNGVTIDQIDEYLHNRHAEERNVAMARRDPNQRDGLSGIKTADARAYLAAIPPARRALLEGLARRVDAITAGTRKALLDAGLESQGMLDAWENTYSAYVPLMREELDYDPAGGPGTGAGFNVRGSASRRAVGSTDRRVVDILANVAMQRERAIVRAEKNRVSKALYGLAIQNPLPEFWLPINLDAAKDPAALQAELISLGLSVADAQNIAQQPKERVVDPRTGMVTERPNHRILTSANVITARVNGKDRFLILNPQNPRAERMALALKNLDVDQLGRALGLVAQGTRWFASVNTQYNPIFGVKNFLVDVQGGLLNLSSTELAGKQGAVLANTVPALLGISAGLRTRGATGQWAQLWREFQETGGQTGYRDQFSQSEDRARALESELKALSDGTGKKAGKAVLKLLSDYNTVMENAVRLSAYKAGLDKGMSKERAAALAKNLTVNFNKKGQVATQMGALYAFFNASVQGTARMLQTLSGPAGKKIIYGGLLLGSAQAMMMAMAGFDEEEPPEFTRERNLIIPTGDGKYLTLPMPLGFNVIPNFSRIVTEWTLSGFERTPQRVAQIATSFFEMFNPIGSAGLSIQTLAPTVVDPIAALAENRDWTGTPIAREDFNSLDPTPGYTRAKDTASEFSKALAEFLNLASGGTEFAPGLISPTPDQLDYLIGQITGGIGREYLKAEQTVMSKITGEELPPYKIPLLGRFYGDTTGSSAVSSRFYEAIRRMNIHNNEIGGRREAKKPVGEYLRENPEARLAPQALRVYRQVQDLRRRKREMLERGASKESIRMIEQQITRRMSQFNQRLENM